VTSVLPAAPAWFRYRAGDAVRLGAVDPGGGTARYCDLGPDDPLALLAMGHLRSADLRQRIRQGRPMAAPGAFEPPVRPGKILCMAKNYAAHAQEFGAEPPPEPVFFAKLPDTLVGHGAPVRIPWFLDTRVDHEAELALVLGFHDPQGHGRKYVPPEQALELVAGCTALNDVTARSLQGSDRDRKWPWLRSKSFDTFCPVGPWVVPADALDPDDLEVVMTVNGQERQRARTSAMVFRVARIVAAMSSHTTLRPGDLIATGTPEGVGPIRAGDRMAVVIEGIGALENPVERETAP
jgi:2-keto-4-pentenoate hydratase/2-oxohepta-3-ene-1,7-dioic acid hydratase in catechol pathway